MKKAFQQLIYQLLGAAPVAAILQGSEGGIYKRIDENRELLELLRDKVPGFLEDHPWVAAHIKAHDRFLTELTRCPHDKERCRYRPRSVPRFPRPWPRLKLNKINGWTPCV